MSNSREVFTIAYTIYAESRGESDYGMCLVASVIYNRSVEKCTTASAVCLQRKQFSCWNAGMQVYPIIKNEVDQSGWSFANLLARDIMNGDFKPFCSSNHYYNPSKCSPSWGPLMKESFTFKNHRFGRL